MFAGTKLTKINGDCTQTCTFVQVCAIIGTKDNQVCRFLLLQFRIADACVVDGLQFLNEYRLSILNIAEGDGAVAEVTLGYLGVDDVLHQFADAFLRLVGQ